jgi:hypothetical protein
VKPRHHLFLVWTAGLYSFTATAPIVIGPGTDPGYFELTTSGTVTDGPNSAPADFFLALTPTEQGAFGQQGVYAALTVVVPEPSTYALLAGLGLVGFAGYRRFRR